MKNMSPKQPFPYRPPYLLQHRFGRTIKPAFPLEKRAGVGAFFKDLFRFLGWGTAGAVAIGGGVYGSRALGLFNPTVVRPYFTEEMLFPIYGGIGGAGIGAGLGLLYSLAVGDEEDRKEWWKRILFGAIIGGSFGYGIPAFYSTIAKLHAAQREQAQQGQQGQQQGQQQQGTQQQGQAGTVPLIAPLDIHLDTSSSGSGGSNTNQGTTQTSFINPFSPTQYARFAPAFGSQKMYQFPLASSILPNTLIPSLNAAKHAYLLRGARRNFVKIGKGGVKQQAVQYLGTFTSSFTQFLQELQKLLTSGKPFREALEGALTNAFAGVLSQPQVVAFLQKFDVIADALTNLASKGVPIQIVLPADDLTKALTQAVVPITDALRAFLAAKQRSGIGWFRGLTLAGLGGGGGLGVGYYLGSLKRAIPHAISPAAMGTVGAGLGGLTGALFTVTRKDEESRKKWFRNMIIGSLVGGAIGFGIPLLTSLTSEKG